MAQWGLTETYKTPSSCFLFLAIRCHHTYSSGHCTRVQKGKKQMTKEGFLLLIHTIRLVFSYFLFLVWRFRCCCFVLLSSSLFKFNFFIFLVCRPGRDCHCWCCCWCCFICLFMIKLPLQEHSIFFFFHSFFFFKKGVELMWLRKKYIQHIILLCDGNGIGGNRLRLC